MVSIVVSMVVSISSVFGELFALFDLKSLSNPRGLRISDKKCKIHCFSVIFSDFDCFLVIFVKASGFG